MGAVVSFGTPLGTFAAFPPGLQALLQTGFLEREIEIGLNSILGYARLAMVQEIQAGLGESITKPKFGRKPAVVRPLNPSAMNVGLDNGLVPSSGSVEQYSLVMAAYGDAQDVNILQELTLIVDEMKMASFNNGEQAARSIDRIAKLKLFGGYDTGSTRVLAAGAPTTTTCHVDDIRGFTTVLVNGVVTAVSPAAPLTVNEITNSSGGVTQTLTVTGVAADAVNVSTFPSSDGVTSDGISGVLTFATATAPVAGDALVANQGPTILRPNGKLTTLSLDGGDLITMGMVLDAATVLRNNAVPAFPNGKYCMPLDNTSLRQLFSDQDLKVLYAGRDQSAEFKNADIISMLGVDFVPTTEAYVEPYNSANPGTQVGVTVRRPILVGQGALLRGNFKGLDAFLNRPGLNPIGTVMLIDGVVQVLRPPLDRLQELVSLAWQWVGDFAVPTDVTANSQIIPTASNALLKRAVVLEHGS